MMKIQIFTTGGTIDKIYFDAKSEFQVGEPQIGRLLVEANVTFEYDVSSLMRKDSLDMTDADRRLIAGSVHAAAAKHIIVTHGTDTMIATARAIGEMSDKVVVLLGSMQPARLRESDAIFNIGFAMAAVQLLSPGVYLAMNGRIFDPQITRKNIEANRFEPVE